MLSGQQCFQEDGAGPDRNVVRAEGRAGAGHADGLGGVFGRVAVSRPEPQGRSCRGGGRTARGPHRCQCGKKTEDGGQGPAERLLCGLGEEGRVAAPRRALGTGRTGGEQGESDTCLLARPQRVWGCQ